MLHSQISFSFEDLETVHVAIFIFCSICSRLLYFYMAFEKEKDIQGKKRNGTEKRENVPFG